jgi:hypothetical protein
VIILILNPEGKNTFGGPGHAHEDKNELDPFKYPLMG